MADVATPSAIAMSTADTGPQPAKDKAAPPPKPERPDEEEYKGVLAKAEKELRASEDRMVCSPNAHTARVLACNCTYFRVWC